jgi:TP901 family phage tail tape measure protein
MEDVGISILDASGDLRDMGTVIEEVAEKWETWTSAQKQAVAVAMAGKRQYNNLIALFDNWSMYTDNLEVSADSLGTLQNQQDTYMESTTAHLNSMTAAAENLYDSLIDTKVINNFADFNKVVLNGLASFVDSIGGGSNAILSLGAIAT